MNHAIFAKLLNNGKTTYEFRTAIAIAVAAEAHGNQMYGDEPYITHLCAVAELVYPYSNEAVIVAYLHDTVEDTDLTLDAISAMFGQWIARQVHLVTDEPGENRKERKRATNEKLSKASEEDDYLALLTKAADRLANMRGGQKLDMYRREYQEFKKAVYRTGLCDELWDEMDRIVST